MQDLVAPNIAAWLAVLAFVVMLLNQGGKLVDRFRSSVKEEPAPAQTYVTKAICDRIQGDHIARISRVEIELSSLRSQRDKDMQELSSQLRALATSSEERSRHIHQRVDDILKSVSRVEGMLDRVTGGDRHE